MVGEHVYVIAGPEAVKIGIAVNPSARLKALQTANHQRLSLHFSVECELGKAYDVEQLAHKLLKEKRLRGEWFSSSVDEARTAIEKAIEVQRRNLINDHSRAARQSNVDADRSEKPWFEGWKFHPLADSDFAVVRFLISHAHMDGGICDERGEWSVQKTDLLKLVPQLEDGDYEDTFWLRVFCFWFDYENIKLRSRTVTPACYPKARIFDLVDFYSDEKQVEYETSHVAAWVIEEYGVAWFMDMIREQSNGYKLKETAA